MSTRQTNRRGVASAMCAEWPHMVSAIHLLAVTLRLPGFYFWREHLSYFHR